MRSWFSLLLLTSAWAQYGYAQTDVDIPYQKFTLSNGLTLIVHEDHNAPIVSVNTWYHVGSKNEKAGKTGFAHLFEHLMFGGSENFKGSFIKAAEKVGATTLNGTTNSDRTNYFETVPTSALDYTLWLESDRMGHLLGSFDKGVLDQQRGVVQNEKRQGENQPYGLVFDLITHNTYPAGHPYSWTTIGSMDDLNAASLDDVKDWFRTYYGPSNTVLVIAGDIDAKTAKAKVEKYYGDIPPGPPVAHQEVWIAKMTGTHRQRLQDRVPQERIYKVWNVPPAFTPDSDFLDLATDVLSEGKTSRLYKRLVYDDQVATDAGAGISAGEISGQVYVQSSARPGQSLAKVETDIDEEMARFIKDGPTAEELQRVKTQYMANKIRGLQRSGGFGGKSDALARSEVFTRNPDAWKISMKRIQAATAEDVRGAAARWLSDGVYVLEVVPFPDYKAATAGFDRKTAPALTAPPELKLPKLQHLTLSNGLKVILAERHELPLVSLWLTTDAGFAADQFAIPGTANLATGMLTSGTKTRNALQISDQVATLGAELDAQANLDRSVVHLSTLKANLDPSLNLFADVILNPSFPEADFDRQKKRQLAGIQREKADPVSVAMRVMPALVYGKGHPYGFPMSGSGSEADLAKITRADLVQFHEKWFHPNNATLVIVGDATLADMGPRLEKLFSQWKPAKVPSKNIGTVNAPQKSSVYLIDRPGAQQTMIVTGNIAPPKNNPQEVAIGVMNDVLGGTFSSRLNMNLREDKHWSYGAHATLPPAVGQRALIAYAPVQTDKTKESMAEMSKEMRGIVGDKPITADEMKMAQDAETLKLPGSYETMDAVGGSIRNIVQFGLPEDYYEKYAGRVMALKSSDVKDAAEVVVHPNSLVWVVVGDRGKIESGVRELGIGDVQVIDTDGKPVGGSAPPSSVQ